MSLSKIDSRYLSHNCERYCQGDVLRDLEIVEWANIDSGDINIITRLLPYTVILTQECDLEQDFNARVNTNPTRHDKYLQSILLCPAYPAQTVREGTHMKDQDLTMEKHNTDRYKLIKQNNNYRYHYLHENNDFQVPELVLDFKQYFTAPRNILYERIADCYLASIAEIFREDLSQRFGYYLSRIGLPEIREAGIT